MSLPRHRHLKETRMQKTAVVSTFLSLWLGLSGALAAEVQVLPAEVVLHGRHAKQQLLVMTVSEGHAVGDVTAKATFSSSNPAVAAVEADGTVRAVGDGPATIRATCDGQTVTTQVKVSATQDPFTWS